VEDLVRMCVNLEQFHPRRILDVFYLHGDGDMVLDVGDSKSWVEFVGVGHGG